MFFQNTDTVYDARALSRESGVVRARALPERETFSKFSNSILFSYHDES